MNYKFNFHQLDPSPTLISHSQSEIDKAAKHLLTDASCQVFYRMTRFLCQAKVEIKSPWGQFQASGQGDNFYSVIDDIAQKLTKQVKKAKEKHQNHKKSQRSKSARLHRLNPQLEYDDSLFFNRKRAS